MKDKTLEAEKAEFVQSVKALFIPFSLFLACIMMAAGTFLIYNSEPFGWILVAVAGITMLLAFIALIRFQNKLRAKGILVQDKSTTESEMLHPIKTGQITHPDKDG